MSIANSPLEAMGSSTVKVAAAVSARATAGLKLASPTTLEMDRADGRAGKLAVSGTVELGGATLSIVGSGSVESIFTLIDNDGSDAVSGTFSGLPQGATVNIEGAA